MLNHKAILLHEEMRYNKFVLLAIFENIANDYCYKISQFTI